MTIMHQNTLLVLWLSGWIAACHALAQDRLNPSRRDAMISAALSTVTATLIPSATCWGDESSIDMTAINAARKNGPSSLTEKIGVDIERPSFSTASTEVDMVKLNQIRASKLRTKNSIVPADDPGPLLAIQGGLNGKSNIKIPRVGYSLYKTPPEQVSRCVSLALLAGVRHFDLATQYGSNSEVAKALAPYLATGDPAVRKLLQEEKLELLERVATTRNIGEQHTRSSTLTEGTSAPSPAPDGSAGRRGRREGLFLAHKISNQEQSTDATAVRRAVKSTISSLGCGYLDLASLHSPLTSKDRRLESYKTLLELRNSGFVKSVGVCNFGVEALEEILAADIDLPAVNQLELSPFHQHKDVVDWCNRYGVAVSCAAWSKLSGADGPVTGWEVVSQMAQRKKMTKAQILVRWSLQNGYLCVPRSSAASKVERLAIAENSYGGVNFETSFLLTPEEMKTLDALDIQYPAGTLGRRDGWEDDDMGGKEWDPTTFV